MKKKILILIGILALTSFTDSTTLNEVYKELVRQEVKHPEIVLKQVIQETGHLKCTNCSMDKNNLFGFYYKKKYLYFVDWKQSITYYKRWQDKHYKEGDYYAYLNCLWTNSKGSCVRYATDPEYTNKLKTIKTDGFTR